MIIKKSVVLNSEDIFDAIKLYLDQRHIALPGEVCDYSIIIGDNYKDNKIIVVLSDTNLE